MSLFEDAMAVAVQLPMSERERLGRALGLSVHTKGPGKTIPLNQFVSRPDPAQSAAQSAAWRKAETGHAVLDTEKTTVAAASTEVAPGPRALYGIWNTQAGAEDAGDASVATASTLTPGSPVIVHTDVCAQLAYGNEQALQFFENPPVEIRLATATYLALLSGAEDESQLRRLGHFVQPYAVLSLGPMASSRSVELMMANAVATGLNPLDALIAATALAHEIPLVAMDTRPFRNVAELSVLRPY
jgi:predicted nucleic acid-binding protein